MSVLQNLDRLRVGLFGIGVRRAVADYLQLVGLSLFILLTVAWTIDLANTFPGIRADAEAQGIAVYQLLIPYLGYRAVDMLTRMLPMACFFGVFLAEIRRRARLETVIFGAGGASPLRMLVAVLIFGALTGALQSMLEGNWRPTAVAAQVKLGHGSYARRFEDKWLGAPQWFVSGGTALRARVLRADAPEMADVLIFEGLRAPTLQKVYSAKRAIPGETPHEWLLQDAKIWDIAGGSDGPVPVGDLTLTLDLIPEQLQYRHVGAFYLDNEPLHAIATMQNADTAADANVAIWRRRTAWLLPGVVAMLAFALTKSGYSGRRPQVLRLIALGLAGYIAIISIKVFWSIGELGALPAPIAVLASISYLLVAAAWLVRRQL